MNMFGGQGAFAGFQQGVQRLRNAFQGIADRVPVCAQAHELALHETNSSGLDFYGDPKRFIPGVLATMEKYGIDVPAVDYDVYNIEAEGLGQRLIYRHETLPCIDHANPLIQDKSDLKRIKTPDFNKSGRFPRALEMHLLFKELTGLDPELNFCAPFSLAANLRGLEQLLMDIMLDPGFAREMFDRLLDEVLIPWISHLQGHLPGSTTILGSDALASLPLVNPEILRDWVLPALSRIRDTCGPGVIIPNWVGERFLQKTGIEEMFSLKTAACPHYLEGQDPDVQTLGPGVYKEYAEKMNLPLVLGIGSAFLDQSTPDAVRERVNSYLRVGGENGRFALLLCNLSRVTPPENIAAAVDAAHACVPSPPPA